MSSPSFLLANETNHDLLQSLLEAMNAIIEHQYTSKKLRSSYSCAILTFTRKSGVYVSVGEEQEEI